MSSSKGNVSYTLLQRREIADYIDSLKGQQLTVNDLESIVKKLASMGEQVVPVCISKLKDVDESSFQILSYIIEVLGDEATVAPLLKLVKEPVLSDSHKAVILNILCNFGVDPVDLPIEEIFDDFDQIAENAIKKIFSDITVSENIPSFLEEFSSYPEDVKLMLIDEFVQNGTDSATNVLGYLARTFDVELVKSAIQGLGKIASSKAASILLELSKISKIETSALAAKELQKCKMLGIEPKKEDNFLRKRQGELYKVIVSSIDGRGSRIVWFVWRVKNRKTLLQTVNFLINTTVGIKDCWGFTKVTENEIHKMLNKMGDGVTFLEGDFNYAIDLLRDGIYTSLENGFSIPLEYGYWITSFEASLLYPKRFEPNFATLNLAEIMRDEELYEASNLLHETKEFLDWFVAEPAVYDFAEKYSELETKCKHKDNYKAQLEGLREKFIKRFLVPQKELIKQNLEKSTDYLIRRGDLERASIALAALLNIDFKSFTKQPFINRIFWESINVAINNMKIGFDMRKNPEDFE